MALLTIIVWRMCGPPLALLSVLGAQGSLVMGPLSAAVNLTHAAAMAFLAVLATFLKNAVLRSREYYADARVTKWEGSGESLLRLFLGYGLQSAPQSGGRWALLRVHPTLTERGKALNDSRVLFGVDMWDLCAVGATVGFLCEFLELGPIGGGSQAGSATGVVATALGAALLIGATGTVLWRASAWTSEPATPVRVRRAGIGLGLGLGVLRLLSPTGASSAVMLSGRGLTLVFPYLALLCLCGWALAGWLATVSRSWAPVMDRNRHPRLLLCAVLGASIAGFSSTFGYLMDLPSLTLYAATQAEVTRRCLSPEGCLQRTSRVHSLCWPGSPS
ncbi:hypothetical protein ACFY0R_20280 [Streptomyces sp. NPDC001633]|uniref:hypothetical protein n=1 Tax=Streptomyces sp. NPDC001633 TaxID=3364595 RepID=UPI0036B9A9E8